MTTTRYRLERAFTVGDFRRLALQKVEALVRAVRDREERESDRDFIKRDPTPLLRYLTVAQLAEQGRAQAKALREAFPRQAGLASAAEKLIEAIQSVESGLLLLDQYQQLLDLEDEQFPGRTDPELDRFHMTADARNVYLSTRADDGGLPGPLQEALDSDIEDVRFLAAVQAMMSDVREQNRTASRDETAAIQAAYQLLDRGVQLPTGYRPLGVSGFRDTQTYLSIADPGDGHIGVTCASADLLRGVVVHVEHIDRDREFDREKVEPYRLPASVNAARVRLQAGISAPVTAFIGRPVFESQSFRRDLLKSVHMTASSCTAMFMNGIADCKIGIERMTATEAVEFMQAVAGNVIRDRTRQYLSAAFNINTPIVDDRSGEPVEVKDRFEIGLLGIDLAKAGGFNKVTWDGASNQVPSVPVIEQLHFTQFLELVHRAHEQGLETYISAGLLPNHMRDVTLLGVGGVGIGTSLHYIDAETRLMGALKPQAIEEVLRLRDEAAKEPLGRGAALLARMDRLYFEGALAEPDNRLRLALFDALKARDEAAVQRLEEELAHVVRMSPDRDHPVLERARRLLESAGAQPVGASRMDSGNWNDFVLNVGRLVEAGDVSQLQEVLS